MDELVKCRADILKLLAHQARLREDCRCKLVIHDAIDTIIERIEQRMRDIEFVRYLNTPCWRYRCG